MKTVLDIGGRLVLTAGAVIALGWGFVALNPPDRNGDAALGVKESNADIFTMSFAQRSSTEKFNSALERLGHEKPRVYDYNGNTVMFSTNQLRGSLDDVFEQYMRTFAEEGVNPRIFRRNEDPHSEAGAQMMEAAVTGGVVPWVNDGNYMAMGGAVLDVAVDNPAALRGRVEAQNEDLDVLLDRFEEAYRSCGGGEAALRAAQHNPQPKSIAWDRRDADATLGTMCAGGAKDVGGVCDNAVYRNQALQRRHKAMAVLIENDPELEECGPIRDAISSMSGHHYDDFTKRVKAYRSIEAWYNKKSGVTKITASWSDETFDMTRAQPSRYGAVADNAAAQRVPLCPGCRRTWTFQGTGEERKYSSNMIISPADVPRTVAFYSVELAKQGWEMPESELVVAEMERMAGKQRLDEQWLRYQKGDEFLHLFFSRDEQGRTRVRTTTAP